MNINTETITTMTEANQNFSKVARMVDEIGDVVILKNNVPKYVLIDYSKFEEERMENNATVEKIADEILTKHLKAFEELAK